MFLMKQTICCKYWNFFNTSLSPLRTKWNQYRATLSPAGLDVRNGAVVECEKEPLRFYRRVQPGVLSCMADIDMCTRVSESKPSTQKRSLSPFVRPCSSSLFFFLFSFHIRFQSGSSCTRNPENWTERSRLLLPTSVLQMNDQLESYKSARSIVGAM